MVRFTRVEMVDLLGAIMEREDTIIRLLNSRPKNRIELRTTLINLHFAKVEVQKELDLIGGP